MNAKIKGELQHAINMLLEMDPELATHARLRVMELQAQLLLLEQAERQAAALERIARALEISNDR